VVKINSEIKAVFCVFKNGKKRTVKLPACSGTVRLLLNIATNLAPTACTDVLQDDR